MTELYINFKYLDISAIFKFNMLQSRLFTFTIIFERNIIFIIVLI